MRLVGGLDPSASARRPSGVAIIALEHRKLAQVGMFYEDDDIVNVMSTVEALAIDSPLSMPKNGAFREIDSEMMRRGFHLLPPSWRGMSMLFERSVRLLRLIGVPAFETHPRSALDASGCRGVEALLDATGISYDELPNSKDALDAVVAAVVALNVVEDSAVEVKASDGSIYLIPEVCRNRDRASLKPSRTASLRSRRQVTRDPSPQL